MNTDPDATDLAAASVHASLARVQAMTAAHQIQQVAQLAREDAFHRDDDDDDADQFSDGDAADAASWRRSAGPAAVGSYAAGDEDDDGLDDRFDDEEDEDRPPAACPACGYHTLKAPNVFDICILCGWEDDPDAEARADEALGGPNKDYSLNEARQNVRAVSLLVHPFACVELP